MAIYGRGSTCKGTCAARKCSATIIQSPLDMLRPKLYVGLRLLVTVRAGQSFCVICAQLPILLDKDTTPGCGGNPKMQDIADVTPK